MLKLNHIRVVFHAGTVNERIALSDVSLCVQDDDFVCILGGNGAGKSTLLNVISGCVPIQRGNVLLDGKDIIRLPEYKRSCDIGRLFQDPSHGTAAHMTVLENLSLAYGRGTRSYFRKAIRKQDIAFFKERLASLHLGLEDRLDTEVGLLSGGQRQALTLVMATLRPPKLLLLDEHTAALDPKTADIIMEETNHLIQQHRLPAIMITHNMKQALQYGNRLIVMQEGSILKDYHGDEKSGLSMENLRSLYEQE